MWTGGRTLRYSQGYGKEKQYSKQHTEVGGDYATTGTIHIEQVDWSLGDKWHIL